MKKLKSRSQKDFTRADLVTVANFGSGIEAQLARTKLQSQNIQSYVFDENVIGLMPIYDLALGGVKLKVKNSDLNRAAKVLGQKSRGNFWAPNHVFFVMYAFGEFFLWILLIPLGLLIYLVQKYLLGFVDEKLFLCDQYLLLCFNEILFSVYCFAYSDRLLDSHSTWINKWVRPNNGKTTLRKAVMGLGMFSFLLAVGLILSRQHFWFSASLLFWCFVSIVLWKFVFDLLSGTLFSKYMKKVML